MEEDASQHDMPSAASGNSSGGRREHAFKQLLEYRARLGRAKRNPPAAVWTQGELAQMGEERMGAWMVSVGLISANQRDRVLDSQAMLREREDEWVPFGELTVQMGLCTLEQVEAMVSRMEDVLVKKDANQSYVERLGQNPLNDRMGSRMVLAGLITIAQRDVLISEQEVLRQKEAPVPRFGEMAVQKGWCTEEEVEALLQDIQQRESDHEW